MAITDNLVAYWKLDAASGNESDTVGSNTLADVNTVGSAAGQINNARDFEFSIGQWLTIGDNTDLSTGDIDFTLACWIKLESKSSRMCFVAKGDGSNGEYYAEYDPTPDRIRFTVCGGPGFSFLDTVDANTLGSPSTGTWYYVVAWHDSVNNQLGISVNAGTADTVAHSTGSADIAGNFYIGSYPSFSLHFDGLIDECGFWKRVLISGERTSLYNGGAGLAYPFSAGATLTGSATFTSSAVLAPTATATAPATSPITSTATLEPAASAIAPAGATLTSSAVLAPAATATAFATSTVTSTATLAPTANATVPATTSLTSTATLAPDAGGAQLATATFTSSATLVPDAAVAQPGGATLTATAVLTPSAVAAAFGAVAMTATGALTPVGIAIALGSATLTVTGHLVAMFGAVLVPGTVDVGGIAAYTVRSGSVPAYTVAAGVEP